MPIEAINVLTDMVMGFDSISDASKALGMPKGSISSLMSSGGVRNGFRFRPKTENEHGLRPALEAQEPEEGMLDEVRLHGADDSDDLAARMGARNRAARMGGRNRANAAGHKRKPIEAVNVVTKKARIFHSVGDVAREFGFAAGSCARRIKSGVVTHGFLLRYLEESGSKSQPATAEAGASVGASIDDAGDAADSVGTGSRPAAACLAGKRARFEVEATNVETQQVRVFRSVRDAARSVGFPYRHSAKIIAEGQVWNGFQLRYMDPRPAPGLRPRPAPPQPPHRRRTQLRGRQFRAERTLKLETKARRRERERQGQVARAKSPMAQPCGTVHGSVRSRTEHACAFFGSDLEQPARACGSALKNHHFEESSAGPATRPAKQAMTHGDLHPSGPAMCRLSNTAATADYGACHSNINKAQKQVAANDAVERANETGEVAGPSAGAGIKEKVARALSARASCLRPAPPLDTPFRSPALGAAAQIETDAGRRSVRERDPWAASAEPGQVGSRTGRVEGWQGGELGSKCVRSEREGSTGGRSLTARGAIASSAPSCAALALLGSVLETREVGQLRSLWKSYRQSTGDALEDQRRALKLAEWTEHCSDELRGIAQDADTRCGAAHQQFALGGSPERELCDTLIRAQRSLLSSSYGGDADGEGHGHDTGEARGGLLRILDSIMERLMTHASEKGECRSNSSDARARSGPGGKARDGRGVAARAHGLLEDIQMYQSLVDYRAGLQQRVSSAAQAVEEEEKSHLIIREAREALEARLDDASSDDGDDEDDCVICWSNEAVVALLPCGHVCLCSVCSALSICPMSVAYVCV